MLSQNVVTNLEILSVGEIMIKLSSELRTISSSASGMSELYRQSKFFTKSFKLSTIFSLVLFASLAFLVLKNSLRASIYFDIVVRRAY